MKHGWEIKKLGEVAYIGLGFTHTPEYVDKGIAFLSVKDISSGEILWDNIKYISQEEYDTAPKGAKPQKGDIMFCRVGTMGKPVIVNTDRPFCTFVSLGYLHLLERNLNNEYVKYWMLSDSFDCQIKANVKGVTIKNLNTSWLKNFELPIPPLPIQERIVSELDGINGILEKKREQLKELDALAQSIFYDMFGDPIQNEKGWEVKKLHEVSTLLNGRAYKQQELLDSGKYKVLRVGNFFTNSNYYYSDLELEEDKYCDNGDLLFAWSASFGAFIWSGGKVIYHYHIWKVLFDNNTLNIEYYRVLLNAMTSYFMNDVHGIGMVHLTKAGMEQYDVPLPPLPLQQAFAAKIAAIEKQKELVKRSIAEVETLLASRMQHYFEA